MRLISFTLLATMIAHTANAATTSANDDCKSAQQHLEAVLNGLSRDCLQDADCEPAYLKDSCEKPLIISKSSITPDIENDMKATKHIISTTCLAPFDRPTCPPIPAVAGCVNERCVDRLTTR